MIRHETKYLSHKRDALQIVRALNRKEYRKDRGVKEVEVNYKKGIAFVEYEGGALKEEMVARAVNEAGYSLGRATKLPWFSTDGRAIRIWRWPLW